MYTLYAVRSKDGKFYKSRGLGSGYRWVDKLSDAKIYGKIGPAKAVITYWAKNYPKHGIPLLVEIGVCEDNMSVVNQEDRVSKVVERDRLRKIKYDADRLERQKANLQEQIDKLNKQKDNLF